MSLLLKIQVFVTSLLIFSCSTTPNIKPLHKAPAGSTFTKAGEYRLGVNDVLSLNVVGQQDLQGEYSVSQSGILSLPLVGTLNVLGLTEKQVLGILFKKLSGYIKSPVINLAITNYESYKVFISGSVRNPGAFNFKQPTTLLQAIATAGGLSDFAKGRILLHRRNAGGKMEKYTANYEEILEGRYQLNSFVVERGDVVYVQ